MGGEPFILCENLIKIYRLEGVLSRPGEGGEVQALQGLDLAVQRGEMVGVVGASGSGKSTLLNILGGLDRPSAGRVVVGGRDLARFSPAQLDHYRREVVGFVWQQAGRNLIPYLTALENVQVPLTLSGNLGRHARARPGDLLRLVGLEERAAHRLEELSGGEQQRVAVAIALANQPQLLLADEPTGELDNATAETIYTLLRQLNQTLGVTVLIVSHDTSLAGRVDRVVAVRDGKLASETVRRATSDASAEGHVLEELLVLDSAGRVQLPREALNRFKIHHRVRLEITSEGLLIRPPSPEQVSAEPSSSPAAASVEAGGRPEVGSRRFGRSRLAIWKDRFMTFFHRRAPGGGDPNRTREGPE
jgi:ABC-type lipoprotein export system ATPase subunit